MSVYLIKSGVEAGTRVCGGNTFLSRECEPVVLLFTLRLISFWQAALAPLLSSLFVFFPLKDGEMPPDIFQGFHSGKCFLLENVSFLKSFLKTSDFPVRRHNLSCCTIDWTQTAVYLCGWMWWRELLCNILSHKGCRRIWKEWEVPSCAVTVINLVPCTRACVRVPLELDEGAFRDSLQNLLPTLINKSIHAHTHTREAKMLLCLNLFPLWGGLKVVYSGKLFVWFFLCVCMCLCDLAGCVSHHWFDSFLTVTVLEKVRWNISAKLLMTHWWQNTNRLFNLFFKIATRCLFPWRCSKLGDSQMSGDCRPARFKCHEKDAADERCCHTSSRIYPYCRIYFGSGGCVRCGLLLSENNKSSHSWASSVLLLNSTLVSRSNNLEQNLLFFYKLDFKSL